MVMGVVMLVWVCDCGVDYVLLSHARSHTLRLEHLRHVTHVSIFTIVFIFFFTCLTNSGVVEVV